MDGSGVELSEANRCFCARHRCALQKWILATGAELEKVEAALDLIIWQPDTIIVSRHPAAVAFITEQIGYMPVLESASEEDVTGVKVYGNLPLHLAALASSVVAIEFDGNPPRGAEYGIEEMLAAGAILREYTVTRRDRI